MSKPAMATSHMAASHVDMVDLLKFKPSIRKVKKMHCGMVLGTAMSKVYSWSEKEKTSIEWHILGRKCLVIPREDGQAFLNW